MSEVLDLRLRCPCGEMLTANNEDALVAAVNQHGGDRLVRSESGQPMHPQNARIPRLRPAFRGERGRIWLPGDDDLSVSVSNWGLTGATHWPPL
jgi:hypothetical protein